MCCPLRPRSRSPFPYGLFPPCLGLFPCRRPHPGVLPRCLSPRLAPGPAPGRPPSQLGVPGPAPPLTRAALTTGNWHCVGLVGPCVEPLACLCLLPPLARGPEDARSARAASRFRLEGLVCPPAAFRPRGCVRLGWPSVQMAFRSRQEGGGQLGVGGLRVALTPVLTSCVALGSSLLLF